VKRAAIVFLAVLLAGCSRATIPNLEDVPPSAKASAETPPPSFPDATMVDLTPEQRNDVEQGVRRKLADPGALIGGMSAGISRFTTQSYIVCGWVSQTTAGGQPFVAMYVPRMKTALVIGVGDTPSRADAVRQRCVAEGVPLSA
jgi:hypothetical protein